MESWRQNPPLFASLAVALSCNLFSTNEALSAEVAKNSKNSKNSKVSMVSHSGKTDSLQSWLGAEAWKNLSDKNYRLALKSADKWIARDPKSAEAYHVKAKALLELGEKERALAGFSQALKLDPKLAIAYAERGSLYWRAGRYSQAERDFSNLIAVRPTADSYTSRAYIYEKMNRPKAVIDDTTKAIQMGTKDYAPYEMRANAFFKIGPYEKSIDDWKHAIALAPKIERLRTGLATSIAQTYDHEAEIEELTKAIESGMKSSHLYKLRADAFYKHEDYKRSADDLTIVLTRFGPVEKWKKWDYLKLRGNAYLRNKDYAKAEKDCTEALAIAANDSKSYYCRADAREHMGKFKEAIQDLTQVIKFDPGNGRAFSMRAKIYEQIGEKAKAASDRKAAIKLGEKQWGI